MYYRAGAEFCGARSDKVVVGGAIKSSAGFRPVCPSSFSASSAAASSAMLDVGRVAMIPGSMARRGVSRIGLGIGETLLQKNFSPAVTSAHFRGGDRSGDWIVGTGASHSGNIQRC